MSRKTSVDRKDAERSAEIVTPEVCAPDNRRRDPRYLVERSLTAIPFQPDRQLDSGLRLYGVSVDLSTGGISFELRADELPSAGALVIGVDGPNDQLQYTGVQIRHVQQLGDSRLRVGAQMTGPAHDFLSEENLSPVFDPQSMEFRPRVSQELVQSWAKANVLRPIVCDHVQLCPKCYALPTYRRACRACLSSRVVNDRLIHHFACAHVGMVGEFEASGELVCPKCRMRTLVVGADFEYVAGPYRCRDCGWSDTELERVAHCLRCGFRFPEHQALEKELITYDVDRLDPLALISAQ